MKFVLGNAPIGEACVNVTDKFPVEICHGRPSNGLLVWLDANSQMPINAKAKTTILAG
jgi:hypothetical protein